MEDWRRKQPCPIWHLDILNGRTWRMMDTADRGVYVEILMWQWHERGCVFPNDETYIAKACRFDYGPDRDRFDKIIRNKEIFQQKDGLLFSPKMREQFTRAMEWWEREEGRSKKASAAATARWEKQRLLDLESDAPAIKPMLGLAAA